MLKKQRKLVLLIFILVILFITYWFGYTSNLTRIRFQPDTKIQALRPDRIRLVKMVQMQEQQQTSWTKPSLVAHATSIPAVKSNVGQGNQHVQTSVPTLSIHERSDPIIVAFGGSVHVRASNIQLRASTQHFRSSHVQFRAGTTHLRVSTVQVRASTTQDTIPSFRKGYPVKVNSTLRSHSSFIGPKSAQARKTTPSDKDQQHTRVVILAYGRTGSSFLGGLFNAHPDVFFIYEPLLTLLKFTNQSSDSYLNKVEEILHAIFNCNFTDGLYLQYLSKFHRHRAVSRSLVSPPFCNVNYQLAIDFAENRKWRTCVRNIDAHALNNACRNLGRVVVKILAPRLNNIDFSWLLRVSGMGSFPLRILYLVRDPRAMHFSRYRLGWIAPPTQRSDSLENGVADCKVRKVCDTIEQHLREITQYTDAIQLIRYEDLATNPEAYVGQLFSSLRLSPSEDVMRWLKEKNHASKRPNHFSLSRELKTVTNSWQKNIPAKLVKIVETRCERIMKYLGYLTTNGSLTLLRNLQNPLFSKQWGKDPSVGFSRHNTAAHRGQLQKC